MSTVPRQLTGVYQRTLLYVPNLDPSIPRSKNDKILPSEDGKYPPQEELAAGPDKANAITSRAFIVAPGEEYHAPPDLSDTVHLLCLDIDFKLSVDKGALTFHGDFSEFAPDIVDAFRAAGLLETGDNWSEDDDSLAISGWLSKPAIVSSSTDGHFHLYIDVPVLADTYWDLLSELAAYGVIEEGYLTASKKTGSTVLRLKHTKNDPVSPPKGLLIKGVGMVDVMSKRRDGTWYKVGETKMGADSLAGSNFGTTALNHYYDNPFG
jgi:hypothetical protein